MIYSIIPEHVIFAQSLEKDRKEVQEMVYQGQRVQVVALENNQYQIQRLISSEPKTYMNPGLQPGTIIKMAFSESQS